MQKMKSHVLNLAFCLFFLLFQCSEVKQEKTENEITDFTGKTAVEKHGKLSVDGTFLLNERGEKVVLKGVSFGWHNWWPRFYNEKAVGTFVNDWECTVVRAAMGIDPDRGYIRDPQFSTECVTRVVDAAIKHGVYVIIDWHSHTVRTPEAVGFFREMAQRYKDYPNVIYEIFNEPERNSWEDVKAYSEEVIKTIRGIDRSNIILVGSPHWDQDVHLAADNPVSGYDNIMYTLHFYAATHHQFLRDRGDYALSKGLPLFVSECAGMEATGDGPINYDEWRKWVDWMAENSISWVAWSVSDKDETCSMMLPSASSEGNWSDNDLKEWGTTVRDTFLNLIN
jgi:endoglucanase